MKTAAAAAVGIALVLLAALAFVLLRFEALDASNLFEESMQERVIPATTATVKAPAQPCGQHHGDLVLLTATAPGWAGLDLPWVAPEGASDATFEFLVAAPSDIAEVMVANIPPQRQPQTWRGMQRFSVQMLLPAGLLGRGSAAQDDQAWATLVSGTLGPAGDPWTDQDTVGGVAGTWVRFVVPQSVRRSLSRALAQTAAPTDRPLRLARVVAHSFHGVGAALAGIRLLGTAPTWATCGWRHAVDDVPPTERLQGPTEACCPVVTTFFRLTRHPGYNDQQVRDGYCCQARASGLQAPRFVPCSPSALLPTLRETQAHNGRKGRADAPYSAQSCGGLQKPVDVAVSEAVQIWVTNQQRLGNRRPMMTFFGDSMAQSLFLSTACALEQSGFRHVVPLVNALNTTDAVLVDRSFTFKLPFPSTEAFIMRYAMGFSVVQEHLANLLSPSSLLVVNVGHWYDIPQFENRSFEEDMNVLFCMLDHAARTVAWRSSIVQAYEPNHFSPAWIFTNFSDHRSCEPQPKLHWVRYSAQLTAARSVGAVVVEPLGTGRMSDGTPLEMGHEEEPSNVKIRRPQSPVSFLDTTSAMASRDDAHPYRAKGPDGNLDCMHWCHSTGVFDPWLVGLSSHLRRVSLANRTDTPEQPGDPAWPLLARRSEPNGKAGAGAESQADAFCSRVRAGSMGRL